MIVGVSDSRGLSAQDLIAGVFANHDFIGRIGDGEYVVQTTEVDRDGEASVLAVDVVASDFTEESGGARATYWFRIEPTTEP